jgi:hypothetical protein
LVQQVRDPLVFDNVNVRPLRQIEAQEVHTRFAKPVSIRCAGNVLERDDDPGAGVERRETTLSGSPSRCARRRCAVRALCSSQYFARATPAIQ